MNDFITLINDDCANTHKIIDKYDALITDPPYNISRKTGFKAMKNGRGGRFGMDFGEWDKNFDIISWIKPALENLKPGGNIVIDHLEFGIIRFKNNQFKFDYNVGMKYPGNRPLAFKEA